MGTWYKWVLSLAHDKFEHIGKWGRLVLARLGLESFKVSFSFRACLFALDYTEIEYIGIQGQMSSAKDFQRGEGQGYR